MISSIKQSTGSFTRCDFLPRRQRCVAKSDVVSVPSSANVQGFKCSAKPLYICSVEGFGSRSIGSKSSSVCRAYEAERSQPLDLNIELSDQEARSEAAQKLKIGIYFATWWALNVVFNIYNKKVLNAFPYPWLTSTLSLATGSLMMLISWAVRIAEPPKTDLDFWKTLFPVRKIKFFFLKNLDLGFLAFCFSSDQKRKSNFDFFPLFPIFKIMENPTGDEPNNCMKPSWVEVLVLPKFKILVFFLKFFRRQTKL